MYIVHDEKMVGETKKKCGWENMNAVGQSEKCSLGMQRREERDVKRYTHTHINTGDTND